MSDTVIAFIMFLILVAFILGYLNGAIREERRHLKGEWEALTTIAKRFGLTPRRNESPDTFKNRIANHIRESRRDSDG